MGGLTPGSGNLCRRDSRKVSSSKTQAVHCLWRRWRKNSRTGCSQRMGPPWPTLHLFVFSLGPTVFSESMPVCPSVGPVLMRMRCKGAAVRLAFIREGQGSSCGDQGTPGCPFPRQAAGATPSPGNIQGHQDCPSGSQLLRLVHTPVFCRSPV